MKEDPDFFMTDQLVTNKKTLSQLQQEMTNLENEDEIPLISGENEKEPQS